MTENNVFPIFPNLNRSPETGHYEFDRSEQVARQLSEIIQDNTGAVSALGGILRRMDVERVLGEQIGDEEFEYISNSISAYITHFMAPLYPLLLAAGHAQFHTD